MDNMLKIILDASIIASDAILDEYKKPTTTITTKPDNSPVTPADIASHNIFKKILSEHYPDIPLVSEEDFDAKNFPPADKYFLLDPLDGTKEFIKKSGEFSISIAMVTNGVPTFGAIFQPTTKSGYLGGVDQGVYFYDPAKTELQKMAKPKPLASTVIVVSPSDPHPERFEKILGKPIDDVRHHGSALKFFSLLDGSANHYPRTAPSYEWDIAAGHALVTALGGHLRAVDENQSQEMSQEMPQEMIYGKVNAKNGHFICNMS